MSERSDEIDRRLDNFTTNALSIYDVMKVVPHPYNAVADMSNHWAHDFIKFAFKLKIQVAEMEAEIERLKGEAR